MFTGEYKYSLDAKNRVSIPARFRDELGSTFYITRGLDSCLFVFSESEWEIFSERLRELPISNSASRKFARTFLSGAFECTADKQGRALLPQYLKDYAGLQKDVYINGAGSRVEIWDAEKWEEYTASINDNLDEIAEGMENLGIRF